MIRRLHGQLKNSIDLTSAFICRDKSQFTLCPCADRFAVYYRFRPAEFFLFQVQCFGRGNGGQCNRLSRPCFNQCYIRDKCNGVLWLCLLEIVSGHATDVTLNNASNWFFYLFHNIFFRLEATVTNFCSYCLP